MPSAETFAEIQLFNPLATPNWRYQRANLLSLRPKSKAQKHDDAWIRKLKAFLGVTRGGDEPRKERLFHDHPDLFVAYHYWEESRLRQRHLGVLLESRLLSGQDPVDIARATGCTPEAVSWYERCWFAVSDRLGQSDWVMNQIIVPTYKALYESRDDEGRLSPYHTVARPYVDAGLRLLAYRGGPAVCEYLIRGIAGGDPKNLPQTASAARDFVYRQAMDTLGRRCALAAETVMLHADNVAEMFAAFARICEIQQKADASSGGSGERSRLDNHMKQVMDSVPWFSGKATKEYLAATRSARYDESAVEPRTDQLMLAAAGEEVNESAFSLQVDTSDRPQSLRLDEMREKLAEATMGVVAEMTKPSQGRPGDEPV